MAIWRCMLGVLVLLLAGCEQPAPTGLQFGLASAPLTLDPRFASDAAGERIGRLLFARLIDHDPQGRPVAALAEWQEIDATHYRLTLRPERAPFSDGRALTSADVVATYRAVLDPALASPHRETLGAIGQVRALDRERIEFVLDEPDPLLPGRLNLGILPAEQAVQPRRLATPVGSGPFELLAMDSDGVRLRRRRDGLLLRFVGVPDPTVRALKLARGELDIVQNDLPPEIVAWLGQRPNVRLMRRPGDTFTYLGFNLGDAETGRWAVRRAIAHAIDRQALIAHLFQHAASPAQSVLPPDHWAGEPALEAVPHDPARARQLLAEAGYRPGRPLRLTYKTSADPFRLRLAAAIQAQLARVGIELRIQSYDWGTFYGDIKAGRFQLYSLAWVGVKEPDILRHIFHSEARPPAGANRGHYRSLAVDGALVAARDAVSRPVAAAAYRQVQREVHRDLVYVPLWYEHQVAAVGPRVDGYALRRDGAYDALAAVELNAGTRRERD